MAARDARYRGLQNALPLFGLFWPPTFAQPHTRAAAVLADELDAGILEGAADRLNPLYRNWPSSPFEINDC
jgi:hypothetical protein